MHYETRFCSHCGTPLALITQMEDSGDVQRLRALQGLVAQELRLSGPGEEDVAPLEALRAATEEALRRQPRR